MQLSRQYINDLEANGSGVSNREVLALPEKVLQFGSGVLSRGIADYFIDKANKQGIFNGRIVLVNSTPYGDTTVFDKQDYLFTQIACGIEDGVKAEEKHINLSVSRILNDKEQWDEILECATNPELQVIIADTAEVDISLDQQDDVDSIPPASFPGKLLAILHKRYSCFNGDPTKGLVIIPTELVPENGVRLEAILMELAHINQAEPGFMDWLESSNHFCHSLIDRVIPTLLPAQKKAIESDLGYKDDLLIMSESFCSWVIETSDPKVAEVLSFSKADKGVKLFPDIEVFRELKLRLLNGTHSLTCGLAFLAGIETVKEAMEHKTMAAFIEQLMVDEIAPAIPYYIDPAQIDSFSKHVLNRFSNPFVEHRWLSICFQYSSKIKVRNLEVLLQHYSKTDQVPQHIALGFAAHIIFMKCAEENGRYFGNLHGKKYLVQDENAWVYASKWKNSPGTEIVHDVLSEEKLWEVDLTTLPGFEQAVSKWLDLLQQGDVLAAIEQINKQEQLV